MTAEHQVPPPSASDPRAQDVPPPAREPVFNLAGVVIALIALCVAIHLVRMYLLSEADDFGVMLRFAFIPLRYTGGYQMDIFAWLAPVTYSLLHGNAAHLIINMIWLAAFGSPLANRIGVVRFLLFWIVTSVAAVALHFVLHPTDVAPLVGASGAISGMMGAAARFLFQIDRRRRRPCFSGNVRSFRQVFSSRSALTFLGVWLIVNVLTAFGFGAPDDGGSIAWEAHIGGFLAGFFLIRLFDRQPLRES